MASALQHYHQLADYMATQITTSFQSWTDFLTTAARLYKYPYHEQLMIYAQRPDATACAEYDLWNKRMGRYIRQGAKGIALIDQSGDAPRLRYVFDVADTGSTERSRSPYLWEYHPEHEQVVSHALEQAYNIRYTGDFPDQLEQISSVKVTEYFLAHQQDILGIVDGSYLEQYHDYDKGVAFLNAAAVSTTYMLLSRCGLAENAHFGPEDFMPVFDFNTPQTVNALGSAISGISEEILRNIEVTIKKYEREKLSERSQNHERTDLHPQRGLLDSQSEPVPAGEQASGQVREDAEEVSTGASPGAVEPPDPVGAVVSPFNGDRHDGEPALGADDAETDAVGWGDGGAESQQPDEMGGTDERSESPGRGSDPDGADLRLTEDSPSEQFSFFPTEAQQIESIAEAERVQTAHSAFSMFISQADIDHILRTGGNEDDARMKIVAEFSKQKPLEDRAAFLKALYHGGNGLVTENGKISAWYSEDGIHIASGNTARYLPSAQVISWADAAERTEELLDSGTFAANLEVTEAQRHERHRIATEVWDICHDLSDEAKSQGYLSCLGNIRSTNYPEETERLTDELSNPAFRETLLSEYKIFMDAYRENRELLRFHYHRPQALLTRLEELSLPRKEYHSDMATLPETQKFITEDEIADSLANGSSFEGGKSRIYAFFQTQHSPKEYADFLKEEYGTGGRSHAVSRESGSFEEHGSKGIILKKSGCADVQMNWNKVASRISELIRLNLYFTPDEQALYDKTLAQDTVRNTAYNSYNAVKEAHPDDMVLYQVGDFFEMYGEDARQAELLLDLNLTSRNIPDVGRVTMCGIPVHSLEQYVEKLRDKYDVTIVATQEDSNERRIYMLPSIDHEAENAINAYEAEFGADGTRVFRDPAAEQPPQPTVRELFDRYKLTVGNALSRDTAFVNACRNSDRQNAYLEGADAIRRIVTASDDLQLVRLYFDMPAFHNRLHQELLEELYPTLATTVAPSPYKVTQEDIDDALQKWNGNPQSKQAVVRYMEQHGLEKDTALWLAKEYGAGDTSQPLQISVGNSEPVILSWPKVQRRLAQLIREDQFFTKQEKPALEQNPDYRLLDRLRADCEYFLGAGSRAEKHLWAGSVWAQIAKMRELYDTLPEKPEWLTKETIDDYAERMAPPYQVVAYHHFENGFDDKLDYQTLAEAETAAQGYVDGIMESDGFAYDGAAIYDRQTRKYLRIYGNYPDERAHAETAGRDLVEEPAVSTESTIAPANRFHVVSLDQGFYIRYAIWDDKTDGYYVDTDGVTEEFTSEWQAEEYRLKLQNQALMEQAKGLISDFCQSEYSSEADFSDPAKLGFNIHNYFFAKALDQVRPGGVVAFVTSRYTMDSQNPSVRKHLAQRADLLGAIRLPNTAFKANAGTEVVSDILFLQRRDRVMDIEPDWVHLGQTEDGYAINSYFLDHPEMVMGKNSSESTAHGMDYTVEPLEDISLADQLHEAVRHIHGTYQEAELPDLGEGETIQNTIPADPDVKNFSYTLVDGEIYFRENSIMVRPELNNTAKERVKGMIGLKTCVRQLIDLQMDEFSPENSIQQKQAELNTLYDSFTEKYGILNSRGNRLAFSDDSAYYLLCALEILDDDGNFQGKADMFSKRTIQPHKVVTSVDTAVEALTISIGERACVDLGYMSSLSGKPTDALATDLKGIIFHDPKLGTLEDLTGWVTADEYLSGNVRQKLKDAETAAAENPMYRSNVDALRAAQPKDLEASEIEVRLGATWIDKAYIQQFMYELLDTPYYLRRSIHVEYSPYTAAWNISNKRNISSNDVAAWNTYGTDYVSAYEILEDSLNLRDVRVYDTVEDEHGKPKRVLNGKQTTLAQQKQQLVRDAFKDWIWADPTRRQTLVEQYNREMNSIRPARLIFLDAELNLDAGGQSEPVIAKSSRPSILSRLKSAPPQSKNPKPKKHHEEVR